MKLIKISLVFLLSLYVDCCVCQFYTSSFEIENLLEIESKILDSLTKYLDRQQKNGLVFGASEQSFVKLASRKNRETNRNFNFDNPIAAFHILNRAVNQWEALKQNLSCDSTTEEDCPLLTGEEVINVVIKREKAKWPTETDLQLAAKSILNVWNVYDLNIDDLANGRLAGGTKEQPLNADDIYFIAEVARDAGMLYESITWFEYLAGRMEDFSEFKFDIRTLYRRLATSYHEYGLTPKAVEILESYFGKETDDKGASRDLKYLRSMKQGLEVKEVIRFQDGDKSKKIRDRLIYEELCRLGDESPAVSNNLRCYPVPMYQWYGIAKLELLSSKPRIELIHDLLSEAEAEDIITYGENTIDQFSQVLWTRTGADSTRRSAPMCERNLKFSLLKNVTKRLEHVTKFEMYPQNNVASSECYTMTNEGLGSLYKPSVDFWKDGQFRYPHSGNRLATVMLQLSDVTEGGVTVFPKLGLRIPVIKGSAVIWWNLKADGKPNPRSIHINCPVVVGSQWAAFKHILYTNQVFRRPCPV